MAMSDFRSALTVILLSSPAIYETSLENRSNNGGAAERRFGDRIAHGRPDSNLG
jgi:hypothetical protein